MEGNITIRSIFVLTVILIIFGGSILYLDKTSLSVEKTKKDTENVINTEVATNTGDGFSFQYKKIETTDTQTTDIEPSHTKSSLQESYKAHKSFIWHTCKEGVKILDKSAGEFNGPTYAGEYMGDFILKGSSNLGNFRCTFIKENNEWGMNLFDVKWQR